MRGILRSRKFRILAVIALLLIAGIVISGIFTGMSAPQTNIMSSVLSPVRSLSARVSNSFSGFLDGFRSNAELQSEIDELREELYRKNQTLVDHEEMARQNEFYREFLGVKTENPSFEFISGRVIARDIGDAFQTFTINRGTLDGVSVHDPVITSAGLVGYISEAYSTQSVVKTILNPRINVSVIDNHSRDSGNVTGDNALAASGLTKMIYIPSDNTMSIGNFVITSGAGGIFPARQIVGTVVEVRTARDRISGEAIIMPIVDFDTLSDVMVITDFEG